MKSLLNNSYTDQDLISLIKSDGYKKQTALAHIYCNEEIKKIFDVLTCKLRLNPDHKLDLYHDGIIILCANIENNKFRGESKISTYLSSIWRNSYYNIWRKNRKMVYIEDFTEFVGTNYDTVNLQDDFSGLQLIELKSILEKIILKMDISCQKVIKLWQNGYSMTEITDIVGMSSPRYAKKKKFVCHRKLIHYVEHNIMNKYLKEYAM